MELKKIKIHYQVYVVTHPTIDQNKTLVLTAPNSIKFIAEGLGLAANGKFITINQNIELQPYTDTLTGVATVPYQLLLDNNSNEYDITQWQVKVPAGASLKIICKYINQY